MYISEFLKEKKQRNIIIIIIILTIGFIIAMSQLIPRVTFFIDMDTISNKTINLKNINEATHSLQVIWWDIEENALILNTSNLNNSTLTIYGLLNDMTLTGLSPNENNIISNLNNDLSGSFNAVLTPFQADLNNDGKIDVVKAYAKIDTLLSQGLISNNSAKGNEEIGFETFRIDDHHIKVLYNNQPLSKKEITLTSSRGLNKNILLDADGILKIDNIKDLRSGINIIYFEDGTINIANYIIEGHSLFTTQYFKAIYPLIVVLFFSSMLIIVVLIIIKHPFKKKVKIPEIKSF